MESPNEPDKLGSNGDTCSDVCTSDFTGRVFTDKVMLWAYATSIIVMAFGIVGLVITLFILSFFYPEKADAFFKMLLVISPMVAVLIANIGKIKDAVKKIGNGKQSN